MTHRLATMFDEMAGELIPDAIWGGESKFPHVSPVYAACFLE